MKVNVIPLLCLALLSQLCAAQQVAQSPKGEIFILSTLYSRHAKVKAYDHATLKKIIQLINADVFVLDASPSELKAKKVHHSKMEYTEVIFPMLAIENPKVYAGEPDEPTFSSIVNSIIHVMDSVKVANPGGFQAQDKYDDSIYDALIFTWKSPADANSVATDSVLAGKRIIQNKIFGPTFAKGSDFWNQNMANILVKAFRENPGKRILLLAGVENCSRIRQLLASDKTLPVVDIEHWLGTKGFN